MRLSLALALVLAGCGGDEITALVTGVTPLNRATRVDTAVQPQIRLAGGAAVDPYNRNIVLYDVTGGARLTVAGNVSVEGTVITYQPGAPLEADHDYSLELVAGSVSGDGLDPLDRSESPEEMLEWPYKLTFRTGSRPRVRAAYLEDPTSKSPSVLIRFSQPMNPITTAQQVQVQDTGGKPLAQGTPVWLDTSSMRVELEGSLDPAGIYTLLVGRTAMAEDGILLDGDDNGSPGGPNDNFSAKFTGSQKVIRSRLE